MQVQASGYAELMNMSDEFILERARVRRAGWWRADVAGDPGDTDVAAAGGAAHGGHADGHPPRAQVCGRPSCYSMLDELHNHKHRIHADIMTMSRVMHASRELRVTITPRVF